MQVPVPARRPPILLYSCLCPASVLHPALRLWSPTLGLVISTNSTSPRAAIQARRRCPQAWPLSASVPFPSASRRTHAPGPRPTTPRNTTTAHTLSLSQPLLFPLRLLLLSPSCWLALRSDHIASTSRCCRHRPLRVSTSRHDTSFLFPPRSQDLLIRVHRARYHLAARQTTVPIDRETTRKRSSPVTAHYRCCDILRPSRFG